MQTDETRARLAAMAAGNSIEAGYGDFSHRNATMIADVRNLLAFAAPPAVERERDESAWLVEENAGGIIHWIAFETDNWPRTKVRRLRRQAARFDEDDLELEDYQTPVRRVKDANEALRFARKEDADAFIALFDRFLLCPVATEHQWPAPSSPTLHPSDREAIAEALWNVGERDRYNMSWERAKAENHNWVEGCYMHTDAILALSGSIPPSPVGEGMS